MKHLLLIEDNVQMRENTTEILEMANYKVTTAENGKRGVEKAVSEQPDLIVCDVMMPILDGYGVLHLLHKKPELKTIPFIFLTAKTERSDFRKGMEMGADDYITKPFTDIELLNAVERRLAKVTPVKQSNTAFPECSSSGLCEFGVKKMLQNFTKNRNVNHYKKKQVIYSEGNHPARLFYIESGKVRIFKTHHDGKELTIGLYNKGDFMGYTALMEGSVYKETAEALEDADIAFIPREEFEVLINENVEIKQKFIQMLAKNLSEKEKQLLGLAYNSLRKRVAEALVTLHHKYREDAPGQFSIHISRENLANIAGTATESLIRTLSDFKTEKLLEIKDGNITILDEKRLKSMVN
ncbi:MAG: transcriptional regulator, Crp/Fnr family [Ferruginibacter sp.]|nr:transcriptional regulator, Crp/Fnr family [Ferruginibacter sp.]